MHAYYQLSKKIIQSNFNFNWNPLPYKVTLILTYRCNFKCKICNIWTKECRDEMTLSQIEKFISKNKYISWFNIGGGEIFLRKDMNEIADIIYNNLSDLVLLDFPTTGFFTDRVISFVENTRKYKPKKLLITVSLDGPKQLHDWLRGIPNSWDRAIATFKELRLIKSQNIQTYLGYTLSKYNFDRFFETIESVKKEIPDIQYEDFHINLAQSSDFYYQNRDVVDVSWSFNEKDKIIKMLNDFLTVKGRSNIIVSILESRYQDKLKLFLDTKKTPLPCKALSASCFIDPNWNLYPCITYNKIIANLRDYDFDLSSIWNLDTTFKLRNEIIENLCPNCWTPCEAYQTILGNILRFWIK